MVNVRVRASEATCDRRAADREKTLGFGRESERRDREWRPGGGNDFRV